ncbi:MAG: LysM peptidoglycan-binding domain-containing protein [Phycisphaeraceae bacterium]|nr:LysM peptidoglycan-binding domain-containing protein [Phycisphaeraceae bacterium]
MARETKVGLIVGLGVILFVSVFVSDYLSVPATREELAEEDLPNFVEQTTNQPEFILTREDDTEPAAEITDPRNLAAVSLENIERREGPPPDPTTVTIGEPPFREAPTLAGPVNDTTPPAFDPNADPVGFEPVDDTHLARGHQLSPEREGPGSNHLADLAHVELPDPQLINAQPGTIRHKVASGETLTAIARKHYDGDGNMWRSIRDANPGKVGTNGEIVQGVVLTIPKRTTEAEDPTGELAQRSATGGDRPQRQRVRMVTVKEGETLSELAAEHLGSAGKWQLIMDVNTDVLKKPEHLRAGMKLRIPAPRVAQVIEEANEALAGSGNARETQPEREQPAARNTYTVKEGDSLYRIAQQLLGDGERYDEIYKANKDKLSSANDIRVGMTLKLPTR